LRANGSRECAPDDRLREAIQGNKKELDCFVACAPRNDENASAPFLAGVGKAQRAHHMKSESLDGGHGASAPLPTLRAETFHYPFLEPTA
jgi:hypothetical protein